MRKRFLLYCLPMIICGCARGLINSPPELSDANNYSEVLICTEESYSPRTLTFTIDGKEIYEFYDLGNYSFKLTPGQYVFGVKVSKPVRWTRQNHLEVNLSKDKKYIYTLAPNSDSIEGPRIQPNTACPKKWKPF